jgi:hypothetical protein
MFFAFFNALSSVSNLWSTNPANSSIEILGFASLIPRNSFKNAILFSIIVINVGACSG